MSEVIEKESTELVTLPAYENALQVFTDEEALEKIYAEVEAKVAGVVYDMSTKKGREQCASDAYKVARSKQAVEKLGAKLSRSEEHTSELQSRENLVCRLLLEKK